LIFNYAMMLLAIAALSVNVFPCNSFPIDFADIPLNYLVYLQITFFSLAFVSLTITWATQPGRLKKSEQVEFVNLVERMDPNLLCPTCEVICTPDSRHCYICDSCIERFDHHCHWVNNCIGPRNHPAFFVYILALAIFMGFNIAVGISCKEDWRLKHLDMDV